MIKIIHLQQNTRSQYILHQNQVNENVHKRSYCIVFSQRINYQTLFIKLNESTDIRSDLFILVSIPWELLDQPMKRTYFDHDSMTPKFDITDQTDYNCD